MSLNPHKSKRASELTASLIRIKRDSILLVNSLIRSLLCVSFLVLILPACERMKVFAFQTPDCGVLVCQYKVGLSVFFVHSIHCCDSSFRVHSCVCQSPHFPTSVVLHRDKAVASVLAQNGVHVSEKHSWSG